MAALLAVLAVGLCAPHRDAWRWSAIVYWLLSHPRSLECHLGKRQGCQGSKEYPSAWACVLELDHLHSNAISLGGV